MATPSPASLTVTGMAVAVRPSLSRPAYVCGSEGIDIEGLRQTFAVREQGVGVLSDAAEINAAGERQALDDVACGTSLGDGRQESQRQHAKQVVGRREPDETRRARGES